MSWQKTLVKENGNYISLSCNNPINTPVTLNCKAPENPKINGGFSGLADALALMIFSQKKP